MSGEIFSINQPQATSRTVMLTPMSINEPIGKSPPPLNSISPTSAVIGSADLVLQCNGSTYTSRTVIVFNGGDEPTTFVDATKVTTIVKPSLASVPGSYPVLVRDRYGQESPVKLFSFTTSAKKLPAAESDIQTAEFRDLGVTDDPDELEEEIEAAEEDGDFKAVHASRTTASVKKTKTKR